MKSRKKRKDFVRDRTGNSLVNLKTVYGYQETEEFKLCDLQCTENPIW